MHLEFGITSVNLNSTAYYYLILEKLTLGNSLAVQVLGLCAFTAEGPGLIPGRGTKSPQAMRRCQENKTRKKERKINSLSFSFLVYKME